MTTEEKQRLGALFISQFNDNAVVFPPFTASQIAFIERLIDARIAAALKEAGL